jgi:hypothetical protein
MDNKEKNTSEPIVTTIILENPKIKLKNYLGDGVYINWDGFAFRLLANDYNHPTDEICIEPAVFTAMTNFVNRCYELKQNKQEE